MIIKTYNILYISFYYEIYYLIKKMNFNSYIYYKKYFVFFNTIYYKKYNILIYELELYNDFYNNFKNKKANTNRKITFLLFLNKIIIILKNNINIIY